MAFGQQSAQPSDEKVIPRDKPEVPDGRKEHVGEILKRIKAGEKKWEKRFERMRKDQKFVRGRHWDGQDTDESEKYVVHLAFQHVQKRTGALYAKNPTIVVKPRPRMYWTMWDESEETYLSALQRVVMGVPMPGDVDLLTEVDEGKRQIQLKKKIARAITLVYNYQISEPIPRFKIQMKQAVRRALTNGIAYAKVGWQRMLDPSSMLESSVKDSTEQIAEIERMAADLADGEESGDESAADELALKVSVLQQKDTILREGLAFSFPRSTSIIVDPACSQLQGFVGARWIAEKMCYTHDKIKEIFKVDLSSAATENSAPVAPKPDGAEQSTKTVDVYEYWDLVGRSRCVVADGYDDFLAPPAPPPVDLEDVHPYEVLSFNDVEDEEDIFPPSNVHLIRHANMEMNRSRQALREHRIANRPAILIVGNRVDEEDRFRLQDHEVNEMIPLKLPANTNINEAIRAKPTVPIEESVYEVETVFQDAQRSTGDQDANFGGTSGATATEASISENSRMSSLECNKDDLDDFLTRIASKAVQIILKEMNPETVAAIAGPGAAAVWPQLSANEIYSELTCSLVAGSSGRPNRAVDISNMERITPLLIQIPEINPKQIAKKLVSLMSNDEDDDFDNWMVEGLPSITALNGQQQPFVGAPGNDPNAQGGNGANNAPAPSRSPKAEGGTPPSVAPGDRPAENQLP